MKHPWFVMIGLLCMALGELVKEVLPRIGLLIFQASGGSYSKYGYEIDLIFFRIICLFMVGFGLRLPTSWFKKK